MAWPTDDLNTTNTDQGTDNPSLARAMINTLILRVKEIIGSRGTVNGVCDLDASSKVPIARLPIGTSSTTAAIGNHSHSGIYEPADTTILKQGAIGTGAGQILALDTAAKIPAVDGSQLTNLQIPAQTAPTTAEVTQAYSGITAWSIGMLTDFAKSSLSSSIYTNENGIYAASALGLSVGTWRVVRVKSNTSASNYGTTTYSTSGYAVRIS